MSARRQEERLRKAIEAAGGLHSAADLAKRWGVSKARADELTKMPSFPDPIIRIGRTNVYTGAATDEFRAASRPAGRPRKRGEQ